jgi:hypothetical protein
VPGTFEVILPLFHCLYDGQEFAIVCNIVLLGWTVLSGVEIDCAENSESIELIENAGNCKGARVSLENDSQGLVKVLQDRYVGKGSLESPECQLCFSCTFPPGFQIFV